MGTATEIIRQHFKVNENNYFFRKCIITLWRYGYHRKSVAWLSNFRWWYIIKPCFLYFLPKPLLLTCLSCDFWSLHTVLTLSHSYITADSASYHSKNREKVHFSRIFACINRPKGNNRKLACYTVASPLSVTFPAVQDWAWGPISQLEITLLKPHFTALTDIECPSTVLSPLCQNLGPLTSMAELPLISVRSGFYSHFSFYKTKTPMIKLFKP